MRSRSAVCSLGSLASARRPVFARHDLISGRALPKGGQVKSTWGAVPQAVARRMSRVRSAGTNAELRVSDFLSQRGMRFAVNVSDLPGKPDLVFRRRKVAVFIHGCFWHGHQNCRRSKLPATNTDAWRLKVLANTRRDRRSAVALRRAGWSVLTIWECDLSDEGLTRFHARLLRILSSR